MSRLRPTLLRALEHLIHVLHWRPHTHICQREERFFFPDADLYRHSGMGHGFPFFTKGVKGADYLRAEVPARGTPLRTGHLSGMEPPCCLTHDMAGRTSGPPG